MQDFKDFYQNPEVNANGFAEKILRMKTMVYKDIAFIATVYPAEITGSQRPPTRGVQFGDLDYQAYSSLLFLK